MTTALIEDDSTGKPSILPPKPSATHRAGPGFVVAQPAIAVVPPAMRLPGATRSVRKTLHGRQPSGTRSAGAVPNRPRHGDHCMGERSGMSVWMQLSRPQARRWLAGALLWLLDRKSGGEGK